MKSNQLAQPPLLEAGLRDGESAALAEAKRGGWPSPEAVQLISGLNSSAQLCCAHAAEMVVGKTKAASPLL